MTLLYSRLLSLQITCRLRLLHIYVLFLAMIMGISQLNAQGTPGLVLPKERTTGLRCVLVGVNVSYECTVTGAGAVTTWLGSAFECPSKSNRIPLFHSDFTSSPGTSVHCGNLTAMIVNCNGDDFTSRLTLTATTALNGETINCTIGGATLVGYDILKVGAPPSPPHYLIVTVPSPSSLTVSWSPPSDVSNVVSYRFNVTGDCGDCTAMELNGTSVTCDGWVPNGQTCSFFVMTISDDCGFFSEPMEVNLSLILPPPPTELSVRPTYNIDGSAQHIDVKFTGVDTPMIGGGVDDTVSYNVMIGSLSFTGTTCNDSDCSLRVDGSQLSMNGVFNVRVVASNAVGTGNATFSIPIATNIVTLNITEIRINVTAAIVTCTLLDSYEQITNSSVTCSLMYGPLGGACKQHNNSADTPTTGILGNKRFILNLTELGNATEYCYTVELRSGGIVLLAVTGTFRSECDPTAFTGAVSMPDVMGSTIRIANGLVAYNGTTPGFVALLQCDSGYIPVSNIMAVCQSDGHWDETELICQNNPTVNPASCGTDCVIAIAVCVFGVFLAGILVAIGIAAYTLCVCAKKGNSKVSNSENGTPIAVAVDYETKESPATEIEDTPEVKPQLELALDPPKPPQPQLDAYADPEDLVQTPQLPPRRYEGSEVDTKPETKAVIVEETDGRDCGDQYATVEEVKPKPVSPQPKNDLYSEVFDALPKGKSTKIQKKPTVK